MTTHISETDRVIAGMLVENTGQHFLDSGGAYGRQWQRNRDAVGDTDPVEYFMAQPEAWIEHDYVQVSIFHFLTSRLEYAPELDRRFRLWVRMDPSDRRSSGHRYHNSFGTVDEFHDAWKKRGWIDQDEFDGSGGLTYNHENVVSQDFHWYFFSTSEESPVGEDAYVFVNIHGGCDARGGYTDFRAFRVGGYDGACELLDFDKWEVVATCPCEPLRRTFEDEPLFEGMPRTETMDPSHTWLIDNRSGEVTVYDTDGNELLDQWTESRKRHYDAEKREYVQDEPPAPEASLLDFEHPVCPYCGGTPTLTAWMPPVG